MLATKIDIHVFRDLTRGGIASALTEIAQSAKVGMLLDEARIPISEEVKVDCGAPRSSDWNGAESIWTADLSK